MDYFTAVDSLATAEITSAFSKWLKDLRATEVTQALTHKQNQIFQAIFYSHDVRTQVPSAWCILFFLAYMLNIIYVTVNIIGCFIHIILVEPDMM